VNAYEKGKVRNALKRPACAILVAPNGTRWSRAAASPGCRRFYRKLAPTPKASEIVLQD